MIWAEVAGLVAMMLLMLAVIALCSGIEVGFYSLNRVRLNVRASRNPPDPLAVILRGEFERPERYISTLTVLLNVAHNISGVITAKLLAMTSYSEATQLVISITVLTPIVLIVGEALPKELFRAEADKLTYVFAPVLKVFRVVLTFLGVVPLVAWFMRSVERIAGLPEDAVPDTRQRIAGLLREGASQGAISASQSELVERALRLRRTTVGDEMIPWSAVRAVPADLPRDAVIRVIGTAPYSWFPAVDRRGNVIGVLRQIDLYTRPDVAPRDLIKPLLEVSPTVSVREALTALRRASARIAIVKGEWGQPVGVVTVRDLIEPLTGELTDL